MSESETHEVYRDGKVHVCAEKCVTCIFRPGNLMSLNRGRVKGMVDDSISDFGGNIPCHKTIRRSDGVQPAICRGFFDAYADKVPLLELAKTMGIIEEDEPPTEFQG